MRVSPRRSMNRQVDLGVRVSLRVLPRRGPSREIHQSRSRIQESWSPESVTLRASESEFHTRTFGAKRRVSP
ncbi:Thymidylate kinase [Sesbania bispinosa]|nr:Thymidylate kinase [Sesbania bispinosa]